jgi:4-aminobutyrate aminotransferase-like enzyme
MCDENNILLTFDEMQSGFARTGKTWGYEHYGVKADLICCGKGMGSGYPISGVLGSAAVMDLPDIGNMSSTHSANPLSCVAGLSTIEEIERMKLISESERKGKILHDLLNDLKNKYNEIIDSIQGKGMVAAVIFKKDFNTESISIMAEKCMQKGLLVVHTGRESIKIGPPLTITVEAIKEGVGVLDESIFEVIK